MSTPKPKGERVRPAPRSKREAKARATQAAQAPAPAGASPARRVTMRALATIPGPRLGYGADHVVRAGERFRVRDAALAQGLLDEGIAEVADAGERVRPSATVA